ncbi:MAG: response regulator [Candidatus Dormibacteria bacterium]
MAAEPTGGGERILIVEDDASYRSYLEERLRRDGHRTAAVADAPSGLSSLDDFGPTILITDLAMPGMGGLELCREVRRRPAWRHLPILVISGADESASIGEVVGLGLIWYLSKGATWEHLEKTLGNLIARAHDTFPEPAGPESPRNGQELGSGR